MGRQRSCYPHTPHPTTHTLYFPEAQNGSETCSVSHGQLVASPGQVQGAEALYPTCLPCAAAKDKLADRHLASQGEEHFSDRVSIYDTILSCKRKPQLVPEFDKLHIKII